jgi:hypothetical protein
MLTDPEPKPIDESHAEPHDVVVLVVPDGDAPARLVDAITEITRNGTAAVLVVFPNGGDAETLRRVAAAGANYASAPSSTELFGHMQRARADARHRRSTEDPLDTLWRSRTRRH